MLWNNCYFPHILKISSLFLLNHRFQNIQLTNRYSILGMSKSYENIKTNQNIFVESSKEIKSDCSKLKEIIHHMRNMSDD